MTNHKERDEELERGKRINNIGPFLKIPKLSKYVRRSKGRWRPVHFVQDIEAIHCKKRLAVFPSPAGMSLTKLSLAGDNLIIPAQGEFGK